MNKIKLNNVEFEVENYNKSTYFSNDTISTNANCSIITDNITALNELAEDEITSIQIHHDDTLIYNLADISARIDSINEWLNGDRMSISVNFTFSNI